MLASGIPLSILPLHCMWLTNLKENIGLIRVDNPLSEWEWERLVTLCYTSWQYWWFLVRKGTFWATYCLYPTLQRTRWMVDLLTFKSSWLLMSPKFMHRCFCTVWSIWHLSWSLRIGGCILNWVCVLELSCEVIYSAQGNSMGCYSFRDLLTSYKSSCKPIFSAWGVLMLACLWWQYFHMFYQFQVDSSGFHLNSLESTGISERVFSFCFSLVYSNVVQFIPVHYSLFQFILVFFYIINGSKLLS